MAENVLIAYGVGQDYDYNFTSDGGEILAGHTDSTFPATNVAQYDVEEPWRTRWGPPVVGPEFDTRTATFYLTLDAAYKIGLFVILNHNFDDMATFATNAGGNFTVELQGSEGGFDIDWRVDLITLRGIDPIVHRPENTTAYRYWRLEIILIVPNDVDVSDNQCSIGRMFLNDEALCFQPSINHSREFGLTYHDPSIVSRTVSGARRATEFDHYRSLVLPFEKLESADWGAIETIYKNQGRVNPIFVLPSPHLVTTGEAAPFVNYDPDAMYGYFPASMTFNKIQVGIQTASVTLDITEAIG